MKAIVALTLLLATTAIASAQQQQKNTQAPRFTNPPRDLYCRDMQLVEGSVQSCMAYTYEQCMASRSGPVERCYLNPIYDPAFRR